MVEIIVHVKPGAAKSEVFINQKNELVIKLRAKPIDGEANEALIEFLSQQWKLRKSEIELIKGNTSRTKKLRLVISPSDWNRIQQTIALSNQS
jgi:hypothetical protein